MAGNFSITNAFSTRGVIGASSERAFTVASFYRTIRVDGGGEGREGSEEKRQAGSKRQKSSQRLGALCRRSRAPGRDSEKPEDVKGGGSSAVGDDGGGGVKEEQRGGVELQPAGPS